MIFGFWVFGEGSIFGMYRDFRGTIVNGFSNFWVKYTVISLEIASCNYSNMSGGSYSNWDLFTVIFSLVVEVCICVH